ncbi:MAG: ribbon-helix-helix protein, CopG family [Nocardioides sp.]
MTKYTDAGNVDLDVEVVRRKDGTRITEADAAEQGETIARHARSGRPSLSGGSKRSPQLGIRVSEDIHQRISARAKAEGKRVSDVVREAIENYV